MLVGLAVRIVDLLQGLVGLPRYLNPSHLMVVAVGKDTMLAMVLMVGLAVVAVLALSPPIHLEERVILLRQAPARGTAGLAE